MLRRVRAVDSFLQALANLWTAKVMQSLGQEVHVHNVRRVGDGIA
jgi:hypothetical protein